MSRSVRALWVLSALVVAAACSGPAEQRVAVEEPPPPLPPPVRDAGEDFDTASYREEPPPAKAYIVHDVPQALLEGGAVRMRERTRAGFRIQLYSTRSKAAADSVAAQAIQWISEQGDDVETGALGFATEGPPPVYQDFSEPYWRVRLGNFERRQTAAAVLPLVRARFEGAFVAPSQIQVRE